MNLRNEWRGIGNFTSKDKMQFSYTPKGTAMLKASFAVKKGYGKDAETMWLDVVMFGKLAESMNEMLQGGDKAIVSGELDVRTYDKKDGTKGKGVSISLSAVELIGGKKPSDGAPAEKKQFHASANAGYEDYGGPTGEDEDIPF